METVFWSNLAFILSWIVGWVVIANRYLSRPKTFNFWKRQVIRENWLNFVVVITLVAAPFAWVNFHQDEGYYDYKRHLDKYKEDGNIVAVTKFHKASIHNYPDNARVNIEYLIFATQNGLKKWLLDLADYYQLQIQQGNQVEKFEYLSHIGSMYSGLKRFQYTHGVNDDPELEGLYNFLVGERLFRDGDSDEAIEYFIKALHDDELEDLAYERLESIWSNYYSLDELSEYAYDMKLFPHLPFSVKNRVYIKDKSWGWYIFNGVYRSYLSGDLAAYLAVGFSLFVWMLFLYQMLYIRKEKWKFIIPLFLVATFFPILVYAFSDLLRYVYSIFEIELSRSDLTYCVVNIGMVEELVKVIPWLLFYLIFKKHFHRPVHFMLLPVVSALGFAFSENLIYVNSNDYELVFVRSGISLIMHVACSSIIGYMSWRAHINKKIGSKLLHIIGGFVLASTLHGVFDYVIFNGGGYLNIIILLVSLHLFILFVNNAINFSGIKHKNAIRQLKHSGVILLVGMFAIFLIQYIIIGWHFSPSSANYMFKRNIIFALVTTIYLVATFNRIKLRPRVLYKFNLADVFGQFLTTSKGHYMDEVDYHNCIFKLFAPKDNQFVGSQLPIRATAVKRVVVQGDMRWWLVKFDKPLIVSNTDRQYGLIKAKEKDEDLFMDKVEVMLLMIPDKVLFDLEDEHHSKNFIYTGRVYSRPVFVPMNKP